MRQAILHVPVEERVCSDCLKAFGANIIAYCDRLGREQPRQLG
jgi:hypothetical protein